MKAVISTRVASMQLTDAKKVLEVNIIYQEPCGAAKLCFQITLVKIDPLEILYEHAS